MKIFLTPIFLFLAINFLAQDTLSLNMPNQHKSGDLVWGVFAGYTNLSFNDNIVFSNSSKDIIHDNRGLRIALQAEYYLNRNWSLKSGLTLDYFGSFFGEKIQYLDVAFLVSWHYGENKRWYSQLGLTYSNRWDSQGNNDHAASAHMSTGVIIPIKEIQFFVELSSLSDLTDFRLCSFKDNFDDPFLLGGQGLSSDITGLNNDECTSIYSKRFSVNIGVNF